MNKNLIIRNFQIDVTEKFDLLNSIYLGLNTKQNDSCDQLLKHFTDYCNEKLSLGEAPYHIVETFFNSYNSAYKQKCLIRIIELIERQILIFDTVEDAAFTKINNISGPNSIAFILSESLNKIPENKLEEILNQNRVRVVLTAHPTQFYTGNVLGIINDLQQSISQNNMTEIQTLLKQLNYTPFYNEKKPTPADEAKNYIWFLEHVFYHAILNIHNLIRNNVSSWEHEIQNPDLIEIGFWPGGDRDGNPFVKAETTLEVAHKLRMRILRKYHSDIKHLKRKITFRPLYEHIDKLENLIFDSTFHKVTPKISKNELINQLTTVKTELIEKYEGLYSQDVQDFIDRIRIFGFHFASIDIRLDNKSHRNAILEILRATKNVDANDYLKNPLPFLEELQKSQIDTNDLGEQSTEILKTIQEIKKVQELNGEKACHRYIISNCDSEINMYELYTLFKISGWESDLSIDLVPLFETIDDLEHAIDIMKKLYTNTEYANHLKSRGNKQTIMLGFSDGTKDGGYLTANWSIYKAKERLSLQAKSLGIQVVFFDGRGGPSARGGGKTHKFYASHGKSIQNNEIQLTVQGQTISSNFGTITSAQYNLEQLLSAGIKNRFDTSLNFDFEDVDRVLLEEISENSFRFYKKLTQHPKFVDYLQKCTTLPFYGSTNIGSRPDKRNSAAGFVFDDLRAIPFVGAWSQAKQNVPGFYGLGSALESLIQNREEDVKQLYKRSRFFRTLLKNSMMALKKTNYRLTEYLKTDDEFGSFWQLLYDEYERAKKVLIQISENSDLMMDNPKDKKSIELREKIVLPLTIIQQYALSSLRQEDKSDHDFHKKLVVRSSFGIINAARNSV